LRIIDKYFLWDSTIYVLINEILLNEDFAWLVIKKYSYNLLLDSIQVRTPTPHHILDAPLMDVSYELLLVTLKKNLKRKPNGAKK
jgi:hypothetical protein